MWVFFLLNFLHKRLEIEFSCLPLSAGRQIMDLWDKLCVLLRAREVCVEDVSNKVILHNHPFSSFSLSEDLSPLLF